MKKHLPVLLAACLVFTLQACKSIDDSSAAMIAVEFATLKVIEESESITAEGVLRYVEFARGLINADTTINSARLAEEILQALQRENLSNADRFLVIALVQQIEINMASSGLLDEERRYRLHQILDWVEIGAWMASDTQR